LSHAQPKIAPGPGASAWHEGELLVQARAGAVDKARKVASIIQSSIPPAAARFLEEQQFAIFGSVDRQGHIWASLETGGTGFLTVTDGVTVRVQANSTPGDPLFENLHANHNVGMLAIDFATRRRVRLNGQAEALSASRLTITARQVYPNCPKYIQTRTTHGLLQGCAEPVVRRRSSLSYPQIAWLCNSDTFFIASAHPLYGADASHRGVAPGFVKVDAPTRLTFPVMPETACSIRSETSLSTPVSDCCLLTSTLEVGCR
jgi:uncharacterized protein